MSDASVRDLARRAGLSVAWTDAGGRRRHVGVGTLRQAIIDANGTPGTDTITFSIGSGSRMIAPTSALPTITASLIIDGSTQPGFGKICSCSRWAIEMIPSRLKRMQRVLVVP